MNLKKINEQTIVITGATSGIGLTTARMAAERGARLVLIARNEDALRELSDELSAGGTRVVFAVGDIADEAVSRRAAETARANFGGFDTWVNNAGGSVYGRIMDVPTEDLRRIFETNVWGVVNGSKVAVEHLRETGGGALINVGSELSDAVVPLQGTYAASKHAVKAFSEALRMELEADGAPVSVTVVKPTAIHTPFPENAKNYLPYEPTLPAPVYAPELVAEAILYCAENPTPEFYVGEMAKLHSTMATMLPRTSEKMNEMMIDSAQNSGEPARANRPDGLYDTNSNLRQRGSEDRFVLERSVYQQTNLHPLITLGVLFGGGVALAAYLKSRGTKKQTGGERRMSGAQNSSLASGEIHEHSEVIGSDGAHVGTIDHVRGDRIKLRKRDANAAGQHHLIPMSWVESIEGETVRLNKPAREAIEQWTTDAGDQAAFENEMNNLASGAANK